MYLEPNLTSVLIGQDHIWGGSRYVYIRVSKVTGCGTPTLRTNSAPNLMELLVCKE